MAPDRRGREVRHAKRPAVPGGALPGGPWGRGGGRAGTPLEEASRLNQQAVELYQAGRYQEALPLQQRSLEIYEQALGPEHPDTCTSLNNLAGLYQAMGAFDKALPLYQRTLKIREKLLGPAHPDTAASLNKLAALY